MGSMHTGLEDGRKHFPAMAAYFAERARGGVGLMVTGGFAPNIAGWTKPFAGMLASRGAAKRHQQVTSAVHAEGGKIALQILHTGRYGYHPLCVAPSRIQSPISPFTPFELSAAGIERQIRAFVRCASLAREAGYDGVEIMGSEGYLINQFLVTHTNQRTDDWGGSYANRMRLAIEIVRRTREALGPDFIIIYRLSIIDLIPGGSSWDEVVELAKAIEKAGATIINSGIGWHESRVPTIATSVPRGAFTWVTKKLRTELRAAGLNIPVVTGNRVNMPEVAEQVLADGNADMISMARPFLADPEFVNKAAQGRANEINTCIACNQACLDHAFKNKLASCLVNPRAGHELDLVINFAPAKKRVAVIGAGPAGLAAATTLAGRGHSVDLFDSAAKIGGQFNMAKLVPGKEEFEETLRYFGQRAKLTGVQLHLNTRVDAAHLIAQKYDDVVLATGVKPRNPRIPGQDLPGVLSYIDVLHGQQAVGQRVALIGAGGIGFDVAEYLVTPAGHSTALDLPEWLAEWGVADPATVRGGVVRPVSSPPRPASHAAAAQTGQAGRQPGQNHGLDSPRCIEDEKRRDAVRRELRTHHPAARRSGSVHHLW
jgi:2,4-dienoyl-CoA reductase (NADPH2)